MSVLRSRTTVVLIRAARQEPRVAADVAPWGLHKTLLMVRRVSPVRRLFRRRIIVLKSRTVRLRETDLRPDAVRTTITRVA